MDTTDLIGPGLLPPECVDKTDWRVLIVDDQEPFRKMLKAVLSREEIFAAIHEASDGIDALEYLEGPGSNMDLVIMDIKMPGIDGIEAIMRLRSSKKHADTPILVLSMDGRAEMKERGLNIGASDYVVKPFDQGELIARVKMLLRRKKVQDELRCKNIEMGIINERLRKLAVTDELTRLCTRTLFFEKLEAEMKRCVRHGIKMTLLAADLDEFKSVNDTFGHVAGDEVLRRVAAALKASIRDSDVAGRYGGEELVAYLVHTDKESALTPAERFRNSVESLSFDFDGVNHKQTVSVGLAEFPLPDRAESRTDLIKRADAALYEAKRRGKNMTVTDGELP